MDAVIFDLDGTLLDSKKTILRCLNTTLSEFGFETFGDNDLYSLIGMDLGKILGIKGANRPDIAKRYTEIQLKTFLDDMRVYEGAPQLLKTLKNADYRIGAMTMRRRYIARDVLSGLELMAYFDEIVGADEVSEPKPSAAHTLTACKRFNLRPEDCIVVGDSKYDILSAKGAGCTAIAVTWGLGYVEKMKKAGADWVVDTMEELTELLLDLK